jgi:hypothetical protein
METLNTLFGPRSEGLLEGAFVIHPGLAFSPNSQYVASVMEDNTSILLRLLLNLKM